MARGRGPGCLVAAGHDAAVDIPDGAGDPAGGRGEQEGDGVGQVAGGAGPAERVEGVEAVQGRLELVGRDELLVMGVATTAGATALTRIWCGVSSRARLRVSACRPPLATEYADDGAAPMAW